jgi:glycosyltransferase involved in cell wall biosynthesis
VNVFGQGRSIIHVGGVGTNSYINAKLMNERGYVAHVAANDIYHAICAPEWQELGPESFSRDELGDDFFPNFFRVAESAEVRKRWFAQGPQLAVIAYLHHQIGGETDKADILWRTLQFLRFKAVLRRTTAPESVRLDRRAFKAALKELKVAGVFKEALGAAFEAEQLVNRFVSLTARLNNVADESTLAPPFSPEFVDAIIRYDDRLAEDVAIARTRGETVLIQLERMTFPGSGEAPAMAPPPPAGLLQRLLRAFSARKPVLSARAQRWRRAGVPEADAAPYDSVMKDWNALLARYDFRMMYGGSASLGLLSDARDYMAYEHGTIRSLPFEDSAQGRLVRAAYEQADAVFITNTDYVTAQQRLEFAAEKRVFVPHAFDERPLLAFATRWRPKRRARGPVRLFMPSRQDWVLDDPKRSKANHLVIDAAALLVASGETRFRITFVAWGDDVAASTARMREKGVEDYFVWTPTLMRAELWKQYLRSDAVLDQFLISGMSGVTYEALTLGCRVITRDDGVCNKAFFGVSPPFLAAETAEEIAERIRQLIEDPDDKAGVGATGRDWIREHHSGEAFIRLQEPQFKRILDARTA